MNCRLIQVIAVSSSDTEAKRLRVDTNDFGISVAELAQGCVLVDDARIQTTLGVVHLDAHRVAAEAGDDVVFRRLRHVDDW